MYIWILLATIMVALSFYNISPRADKESAVSEIKSAILVERLKAEHTAAYRTLECEMLFYRAKYGVAGNKAVTISSDLDVGYTTFKDNLPMGYDINVGDSDDNAWTVTNKLFCLDNPVYSGSAGKGKAKVMENCIRSTERYVVSFIQIPDRWLSKTEEQGKEQKRQPIPAFVNYLAKEDKVGDHYGWVTCESSTSCKLEGRNAPQRAEEQVDGDSPFWDDADFKTTCRSGKTCLFAYKRMPNTDINGHCNQMAKQYKERQQAAANQSAI
jgi:hypothetical protein